MRAYELYLRNKDSTTNVCQTTKPVKKIFINKVKVPIDNTIIDQYDSERIGIFYVDYRKGILPSKLWIVSK